ncbi:MAG: response regulator, partial [Bacteroidota bacterium]
MEELKPSTILVVEDEKVTQLVISHLLKREGFNVMKAAEGSEALRVLRAEKVDLILSDIHMPVMDGFTFFEKVQEDPKLHQIPFVFLTSLTGQEHLMLGK